VSVKDVWYWYMKPVSTKSFQTRCMLEKLWHEIHISWLNCLLYWIYPLLSWIIWSRAVDCAGYLSFFICPISLYHIISYSLISFIFWFRA